MVRIYILMNFPLAPYIDTVFICRIDPESLHVLEYPEPTAVHVLNLIRLECGHKPENLVT